MIMVWNNWCTSLLEKKNTLDLLLTSLPDKLSDHDIIAGTLKVVITPPRPPPTTTKGTSEKGVRLFISETEKDDYESMRKDAFAFTKEKYHIFARY